MSNITKKPGLRIGKKIKAVIAGIGLVTTPLVAATADNVIGISETQALAAAGIEAAVLIWATWRAPNTGFVDVDKLSAPARRALDMDAQHKRARVNGSRR